MSFYAKHRVGLTAPVPARGGQLPEISRASFSINLPSVCMFVCDTNIADFVMSMPLTVMAHDLLKERTVISR